jgi:hypothetical protein
MTFSQLCHDVSDHPQIINADESCWRVYSDSLRTRATTAAQNVRIIFFSFSFLHAFYFFNVPFFLFSFPVRSSFAFLFSFSMIYLYSLSLLFSSFPFGSANQIVMGLFLWIFLRKRHLSIAQSQ